MDDAFATRVLAAVDAMSQGMQIVDPEWRYVYVNETAAAHGRLPRERLVGRTMMECYPGIEHTAMFATLGEAMRRRERRWLQNQFTYPDGKEGWFELLIDPVPDGILILSMDVTARKRAEKDDSELEALSYSIAHDLRTPLRAMDGFSQRLLADHSGSLGPSGVDHLRRVRAAAQRMTELIEDLAMLTRVTRAELQREHVDLCACAQQILSRLQKRHPERAVEIVIARDLVAYADHHLVTILCESLLSNAWKFSAKQPRARIELGREGKAFFVRDNGVGFDMAYADQLFGLFKRLHRSEECEGTGIGLAIAARIVRHHGGAIWPESAPERGATFFFTLHP